MRQTHERQQLGGIELIKVVHDKGHQKETHQMAPTPRISNKTMPTQGTCVWEEGRVQETNKMVENMIEKMEMRLMQRMDALEARMIASIGEQQRMMDK